MPLKPKSSTTGLPTLVPDSLSHLLQIYLGRWRAKKIMTIHVHVVAHMWFFLVLFNSPFSTQSNLIGWHTRMQVVSLYIQNQATLKFQLLDKRMPLSTDSTQTRGFMFQINITWNIESKASHRILFHIRFTFIFVCSILWFFGFVETDMHWISMLNFLTRNSGQNDDDKLHRITQHFIIIYNIRAANTPHTYEITPQFINASSSPGE